MGDKSFAQNRQHMSSEETLRETGHNGSEELEEKAKFADGLRMLDQDVKLAEHRSEIAAKAKFKEGLDNFHAPAMYLSPEQIDAEVQRLRTWARAMPCGFQDEANGLVAIDVGPWKWLCPLSGQTTIDRAGYHDKLEYCRICKWQMEVAHSGKDLDTDVGVPSFEGPLPGRYGWGSHQDWLALQPDWVHKFEKEQYPGYWENLDRNRRFTYTELHHIWERIMEGYLDGQSFDTFIKYVRLHRTSLPRQT